MNTDVTALSRAFLATLDAQDWPALMERVAPGCVSHVGGQDLDRAHWQGMGQMFFAAFPDGRHVIERQLADGDTAVTIGAFEGTHRGEFMGIPATGRRIQLRTILLHRWADGRVIEHWGQFDSAGLVQQLTA